MSYATAEWEPEMLESQNSKSLEILLFRNFYVSQRVCLKNCLLFYFMTKMVRFPFNKISIVDARYNDQGQQKVSVVLRGALIGGAIVVFFIALLSCRHLKYLPSLAYLLFL